MFRLCYEKSMNRKLAKPFLSIYASSVSVKHLRRNYVIQVYAILEVVVFVSLPVMSTVCQLMCCDCLLSSVCVYSDSIYFAVYVSLLISSRKHFSTGERVYDYMHTMQCIYYCVICSTYWQNTIIWLSVGGQYSPILPYGWLLTYSYL